MIFKSIIQCKIYIQLQEEENDDKLQMKARSGRAITQPKFTFIQFIDKDMGDIALQRGSQEQIHGVLSFSQSQKKLIINWPANIPAGKYIK